MISVLLEFKAVALMFYVKLLRTDKKYFFYLFLCIIHDRHRSSRWNQARWYSLASIAHRDQRDIAVHSNQSYFKALLAAVTSAIIELKASIGTIDDAEDLTVLRYA